jgi:hypothetical protein
MKEKEDFDRQPHYVGALTNEDVQLRAKNPFPEYMTCRLFHICQLLQSARTWCCSELRRYQFHTKSTATT